MIYNPYNTTMPNTGAMQPGTLQPSNYQVAQQPMMPVNNYQSTTMPLMNTAGYQPVQAEMSATQHQMTQSMPMMHGANYQPVNSGVLDSNYQMAQATPMANAMNYQTVQPVMPMVPAVPMQVGPVPCGSQVPTCAVPVQPVPIPQPVPIAQPAQQVQTVQQTIEPQVVSTQATTAHHKKTTYVEAYLEPVDANVPLIQPTVKKHSPSKKADTIQGEIVYVEQKPVKNSTVQDYNLYLMEKEYYSSDQPSYSETIQLASQGSRADMYQKLTCENLPLATAYVPMQSYTNLNNSSETLKEGTAFHDLYDVYTPKNVSTPYIYMHKDKGGRQ